MLVRFASDRLKKSLESPKDLSRSLGGPGARRAQERLASLRAAPSLEDFRHLPGRCHELKGSRSGQLALDVTGGKRLIFEPIDDPAPKKPDGGLDWSAVRGVTILEIEDYH